MPIVKEQVFSHMPDVSIIITSYNYSKFIARAIESVLKQTWKSWELLIVDDGSTDNSVEVIYRYVDGKNIRLLRHPGNINKGLASSLQLGIKESKSPIIAFLESDDYWMEDCVEKRMSSFVEKNANILFNNAKAVSENYFTAFKLERYFNNLNLRFPSAGVVDISSHVWLSSVLPSFSCVMGKKEIFEACDFWSPVPEWLDWWLWFQVSQNTKFVYVKDRLTFRQIHKNSYSSLIQNEESKRRVMLDIFCSLSKKTKPFLVKVTLGCSFISVNTANRLHLLKLWIMKWSTRLLQRSL